MFQVALSSTRKSIVSRAMTESNTSLRGIQSKQLLINLDEAKGIPICINCKYYHPHTNKMIKEAHLGKCHKYGEFDVIDGSIIYKSVDVARQYFCHGNQYEEKDMNKTEIEDYKDFLK